jgi:hypothetical protein
LTGAHIVPGGTVAALALAAIAAVFAFACTEQRARERSGRSLGLAAVVVAALCSFDALRAGGAIVSAAFAAALVLTLERSGRRAGIAATCVTLLWCNVSTDGVLAPLIALAFALGATFDGSTQTARRSAWYVTGACAIATFATPALATLPLHMLETLRIDRALSGIVAMHPVEVAPQAYRIGFTLAVVAFFVAGSGARARVSLRDALLVVLAMLLALANGAYLAIFGVLVAPVLAGLAYATFVRGAADEARDAHHASSRTGDAVVGTAALLLALALAVLLAPRANAALALQPYALANVAFASGPHRFYCANVDWCSYAVAEGPRGTSALVDGRITAASGAALDAQRTIAHASPGWRAVLERRHIDVMLVRHDRALATLLRMRGDWRVLASDDAADLFTRTKRMP